jgi:hypothetical protein
MLRLRLGAALGFALLLATAPAYALSTTYQVLMTGALEVLPNIGDPDGLATGTITLDDVTGGISWNISYSNLEPTLSGFHIHTGAVGVNGAVLVSLGTATTGGPGTLISSTTTTLANINAILANPTGFYVNIHTTPTYPNGAVRGQLGVVVPEPTPAQLIGLGAIALAIMRRRRLG